MLAASVPQAPAFAVRLGIMGDSLSDEYAEESYDYAENWVEQLVIYGGIDVGAVGAWGGPRRTRYEYNWARAGATTGSLLSDGQHTGLAGQVAPEGITYAVMAIGANDFAPFGAAYDGIYYETWPSSQIDTYVNQRVANLNAALDTVLPTGVELALVNVPDYGVTPTVQLFYSDPAKRQLVADVIAQLNAAIDTMAQTRQLPVVDLFGAALTIFGPHGGSNSTLTLGSVDIDLLQFDTASGGNPTAGFVNDGIHPNTTLQGILANTFVEALNAGYAANLPLFSEQQILAHRGLAYGGSDTLAAQLGEYADYVINHASEPACSDGLDRDGDGLADFPEDPGCTAADDLSEHSLLLVCDDGIDNDGDGDVDYPSDPACWSVTSNRERSQCQDGVNNDGQLGTDFDGGESILGAGNGDLNGADPQCVGRPWKNREAAGGRRCGLGFEIAVVLVPLLAISMRRRRTT